MDFLTDFADEAVILPFAAIIAVGFAALGWWRGALAWTVCVGGVLGVMLLLKILFVACSGPLAWTGIHSPSGHTAAATVAYGGLILVLGRGRLPLPLLLVGPVLIVVAIGVSRLTLHAHVPVEVVVGGLVGLTGAVTLMRVAGPRPPLRSWPVGAAALCAILAFHGVRLQAEQTIHALAMMSWLRLSAMCRA